MKKIAFLLFMVFATVQLAPAVMAVFMDATSVFIADEEKGEEKVHSADSKEKKDYASFSTQPDQLANNVNTAFHRAEQIHPFPCLEKLTPPPNFC